MILFVSDLHYGRRDVATEHAHERDLVACLRAHEDDVTALYLLGDLYDAYIEYRYTMPKGLARLQGLLAEWTDRGIPVSYFLGNHDPWHQAYYAEELGVEVVADARIEVLQGMTTYLAHGDGLTAPYRFLKPLLRHPLPVWCYRTLLPGDVGMRLARWVKSSVEEEAVEVSVIESLRQHARGVLRTTDTSHVVLAHSHHPEHLVWPEGTYLNTGSWRFSRSFVTLHDSTFTLKQWNGICSQTVPARPAPSPLPDKAAPVPAPIRPVPPATKVSHDV